MSEASRSENVTRVEVERIPNPDVEAPQPPALGRTGRALWTTIALASAIYIFVPEPTDVFPVLGWLDEGMAFMLLTTALAKLEVNIPILNMLLNRKQKSRSGK